MEDGAGRRLSWASEIFAERMSAGSAADGGRPVARATAACRRVSPPSLPWVRAKRGWGPAVPCSLPRGGLGGERGRRRAATPLQRGRGKPNSYHLSCGPASSRRASWRICGAGSLPQTQAVSTNRRERELNCKHGKEKEKAFIRSRSVSSHSPPSERSLRATLDRKRPAPARRARRPFRRGNLLSGLCPRAHVVRTRAGGLGRNDRLDLPESSAAGASTKSEQEQALATPRTIEHNDISPVSIVEEMKTAYLDSPWR